MKTATRLFVTVSFALILTGCESIPKSIWNTNPEAAAKPQPEPQPVQEEVAQPAPSLKELIEQDLAANRLSKPRGNNAIEKIEQLRRESPNDPAVSRYENAVINRYLALVEKRLKKNSEPQRKDLERALRYINTARSLQVPSSELDQKEEEILELLDIVIQKEQLQKAMAESAEKAAAQAAEESNMASEETSEEISATAPNPNTNNPNFLNLDQSQINARSQEINLQLDSISQRIIDNNATVIIHAQSMNDFRYLSASLRTSLYWVDPDFNVSAEPHINQSVSPGIELIVNE